MHNMRHQSVFLKRARQNVSGGVQCRQLQKAQAASQMPLGRSLQAHYQSTDPQQQGDLMYALCCHDLLLQITSYSKVCSLHCAIQQES